MPDFRLCGFILRVDEEIEIESPYNLFLCKAQKPDLFLEIKYFQNEFSFWGKLLFNAQGYWEVYRLKDGKILFLDGFNGHKGWLSRYCIIDEKKVAFYYKKGLSKKYQNPFIFPLGPLLLLHLLSNHKIGFMLHACCAVSEGNAYLFIGPSGIGKSTIAEMLYSQKQIINDDRVVVKVNKGGFECYGIPWYYSQKRYFSPSSGRISKIFILGKKGEEYIKRLTPLKAFRKIYPSVFFALWNRKTIENTLGLVKTLLSKVPCYELGFRKNSDIYTLLC